MKKLPLIYLLTLCIFSFVSVKALGEEVKPFAVSYYEVTDVNKSEQKIGDYDTFADATLACANGNMNRQYIITLLKDYIIEPSESFEHKYQTNLIIRSAKNNRFTLTRKGTRLLMALTEKTHVHLENIILDGSNESGLMTLLSYNSKDEACSLTIGKDTIIRNFTYNPNFQSGPILLNGFATLNVLEGATIENNKSEVAGFVLAGEDTTINIKGGIFRNNTSNSDGGVIASENVVNIEGATFENNSSLRAGGVITLFPSAKLNINNTKFINNSSSTGGAIYSASEKEFTISNSSLLANKAKWGGAIFSTKNATISNCLFKENVATKAGGGLYLSDVQAKISNTNFKENNAENGGGLYLDEKAKVEINNRSSFENNVALINGGAIFTENYNYTHQLDPSRFYQNINSDNTTLYLNNVAKSFLANPPLNASEFTNLLFSNNSNVKHQYLERLSLLNNYDINFSSAYRLISFAANGGKFIDGSSLLNKEIELNKEISLIAGPQREGYQFLGWDLDKLSAGSKYIVKENHVFVATWLNEPPTIEVENKTIKVNENINPLSLIKKAIDKEDGAINVDDILVNTTNLDISKQGRYVITYSYTDKGGNTVNKEAVISVVAHSEKENKPINVNGVSKRVVNTCTK